MSPTGFIGVCSLGVQKVIYGGFDKNKNYFYLKKDSNYFNKIHRKKKFFEHDEQKFFFANYSQWRTY